MNNTVLTILSLSVSGSVIALVILALRPLLKNKVSKTFQYYIWLLVLLRLALPLSFDGSIMGRIISQAGMAQAAVTSIPDDSGNGTLSQKNTGPQGSEQSAAQKTSPSGTAASGGALPNSPLPSAPEPARFSLWSFVLDHLTSIWLLGAVLYFGWFIIAYLRFSRKTRKTGVRPHPKDMEVFATLHGAARVQLSRNPYIDTPMLIGFLSPCIVIPDLAFAENGMASELQHILRHELTHYRRRDLLYKWFVAFVSALHWFNPLMILVRREISRSCELSCDEAVIRSLDITQRQSYGETLLVIASNKRLPTGIVTTTMCEGKRELKERLESIMTYKSKGILTVALSLVLALLIGGCSVALGAANVTSGASPSPAATDTPVVSTTSGEETAPSPTAADTPGVSAMPGEEATPSPEVTVTPGASMMPAAEASPSSAAAVTSSPSSADNSVLGTYTAVLQNKAGFFSTDNMKELYLKDFLTNKEIYGTSFDVTHFSVLDMDGDKAPEVVLELSVGGEPQFYEVLRYMNGAVNGYLIVYRGLEDLKTDGTFYYSNGAADYGWGKLRFEATAYTTDISGYSQSSQSNTALSIKYFVNDKPVTKESFNSFEKEQSGKKDAVWYGFSQKNIEAELAANP